MQTCRFLLEQSTWSERNLPQNRPHHDFHVRDVSYLRYLRFQFRDSSCLSYQGFEHEPKPESRPYPHFEHGMHVSTLKLSASRTVIDVVHSASSGVLVRLAYVPTFLDPEFLYATVPIAIWSEIEMSLAITAGSLPTLRPLYRIAAEKFSWKVNFFSSRTPRHASRATMTIGGSALNRKEFSQMSCGESERKVGEAESEDFILEDIRPVTKGKFMGITRETCVQIDYEGSSRV